LIRPLHERHHSSIRHLVRLLPNVTFDSFAMRNFASSCRVAALASVECEDLPVAFAVGTSSSNAHVTTRCVLQQLLHSRAGWLGAVEVRARSAVIEHLHVSQVIGTLLISLFRIWIIRVGLAAQR